MSKNYDNNMRGILGKNDRRKSDSHPEYTGQCEIDGRRFWISAWVKKNAKTGRQFFSLSFKEMQDEDSRKMRGSEAPAPSQHSIDKSNAYQPQPGENDGDNLPF